MNTNYKIYFQGMFEAIDNITLYTEGLSEEAFKANSQVVDAVLWNLKVIDEGLRHTPAGAIGFDWRLVHALNYIAEQNYYDLNPGTVWHLVEVQLPKLKHNFEYVFERLSKDDSNGATR
jgi:uncharacterized protein with HEPN domain